MLISYGTIMRSTLTGQPVKVLDYIWPTYECETFKGGWVYLRREQLEDK